MAQTERLICATSALEEGGAGVRFEVLRGGMAYPAFTVRFKGKVYGYLNRCGHVPVELDWQAGVFFDTSGLYLICSTHGALYDPANGKCLLGRCDGRGLEPLPMRERDGAIYLRED